MNLIGQFFLVGSPGITEENVPIHEAVGARG